jgi:ankyrin repeat protein
MLEMKSIDEEARLRSRKGEWTSLMTAAVEREGEWTSLMTAAVEGHLDICRLLIDKGAQIEAKEGYGMTPLHFADCKPHIDIVRLLCDHGADFEASDCNGWRPLHFAARYGHISVVKELIEVRNAEINARDDHGGTALMYSR